VSESASDSLTDRHLCRLGSLACSTVRMSELKMMTHYFSLTYTRSGPQRRVPRNCDASQLENPRWRPVTFSTVDLTLRRRATLVIRQLDATTPQRRNEAATPQRNHYAATKSRRRNAVATTPRRLACDPST
jgi:hypothetical protein